jgi:hypothetical protein
MSERDRVYFVQCFCIAIGFWVDGFAVDGRPASAAIGIFTATRINGGKCID